MPVSPSFCFKKQVYYSPKWKRQGSGDFWTKLASLPQHTCYVFVDMADLRLANCMGEMIDWFLKFLLVRVAYVSRINCSGITSKRQAMVLKNVKVNVKQERLERRKAKVKHHPTLFLLAQDLGNFQSYADMPPAFERWMDLQHPFNSANNVRAIHGSCRYEWQPF